MKELVGRGVDINSHDLFQRTALHAAAYAPSKKCAEFLIDRGASIDALDDIGMTPLMTACSRGKKKGSDVALLLLQHGADAKHVRIADGMTAYKFALSYGTDELLQALIAAGAEMPEPGFQIVRLK